MKILIIEDEKRLAEAVAQNLRRQNFDIDISHDGEEGLDNALSGIYDVILLDIMLPKKDGLSVLSELRAEGVETPVILLTALAEVEDRVRGLDRGAETVLVVEMNMGQILPSVKSAALYPDRVFLANRIDGMLITPADIETFVRVIDGKGM